MLTGHHVIVKNDFFKEVSKSLRNNARKYENALVVGDLNINILDKKRFEDYLSELCDTFSLLNLISEVTCAKSLVGTSSDKMLTKRPRSFHHTSLTETGMRS